MFVKNTATLLITLTVVALGDCVVSNAQAYRNARIREKKIPVVLATIEKISGRDSGFFGRTDLTLHVDELLFGWLPEGTETIEIKNVWSLQRASGQRHVEPETGMQLLAFLLRRGDTWEMHPVEHYTLVVSGPESAPVQQMRHAARYWNARDQWVQLQLVEAGAESDDAIEQAVALEILRSPQSNDFAVPLDDLIKEHEGREVLAELYQSPELKLQPLLVCERAFDEMYPGGNWKHADNHYEKLTKAVLESVAAGRGLERDKAVSALSQLAGTRGREAESLATLQKAAGSESFRLAAYDAMVDLYRPQTTDEDLQKVNADVVAYLSDRLAEEESSEAAATALADIAYACGRRAIAPTDVIDALRGRHLALSLRSDTKYLREEGLRRASVAYRAVKQWLKQHPDAVVLSEPWEALIGKQVVFAADEARPARGMENYVEIAGQRIWIEGEATSDDPFGPFPSHYSPFDAKLNLYAGVLKKVEDMTPAASEDGELIIIDPAIERKLNIADGNILHVPAEERREVAEYVERVHDARGDRKDARFMLSDPKWETVERSP